MAQRSNKGNNPKRGKSNNQNRGKGNYRNSKLKNEREMKEIINTAEAEERIRDGKDHVSKSNPYSWYSRFPQFTKDAGTVAFGIPLGQPISFPGGDFVTSAGVMALHYIPTIGYSSDLTSPINRSAIRFYTYLRDVQKAATKYDAADVMMYLMAIDSLYAFWAMMRRAYGVAQLFTPVNKYYPAKLLSMMGIDQSITQNLAEFRAYINRFALSLGSYTTPEDFDITARHMWMCEGLYVDSDTTRAQTYMFVPLGFWKFNNTVTTGSQLDWVEWKQSGGSTIKQHTLSEIMTLGDSLINAILNDQDTGNISGDFYSASVKYGTFKLRKVEETPDGFAVLPIYDKTVLSQIENCNIVGGWASDYTPVISQNPSVNNGAILFTPKFRGNHTMMGTGATGAYYNANFSYPGQFLNMHIDSPDPEAVIEASRLMVCMVNGITDLTLNKTAGATGAFSPTCFGADVIADTVIGVMNNTGGMQTIVTYTNSFFIGEASGVTATMFQYLALKNQFDWSPLTYMYNFADGVTAAKVPSDVDLSYIDGDIDNLTWISGSQLAMMHEASMLSLFDIPQMGM